VADGIPSAGRPRPALGALRRRDAVTDRFLRTLGTGRRARRVGKRSTRNNDPAQRLRRGRTRSSPHITAARCRSSSRSADSSRSRERSGLIAWVKRWRGSQQETIRWSCFATIRGGAGRRERRRLVPAYPADGLDDSRRCRSVEALSRISTTEEKRTRREQQEDLRVLRSSVWRFERRASRPRSTSILGSALGPTTGSWTEQ